MTSQDTGHENSNNNTDLWRPHPVWPLYHYRTVADNSGHRSVWPPPAWEDSASASLCAHRCHTWQPERKQWANVQLGKSDRDYRLHFMTWTTALRLTYVAEEHGVFRPALLRAELLCWASILCCHQLLWDRVAVDAGVTVFPPVFS